MDSRRRDRRLSTPEVFELRYEGETFDGFFGFDNQISLVGDYVYYSNPHVDTVGQVDLNTGETTLFFSATDRLRFVADVDSDGNVEAYTTDTVVELDPTGTVLEVVDRTLLPNGSRTFEVDGVPSIIYTENDGLGTQSVIVATIDLGGAITSSRTVASFVGADIVTAVATTI